MLVGRKYRAYLNEHQAEYAEHIGHACRTVWNVALEQRLAYRRRNAYINYRDQARELAEAKSEHPWLSAVPGHCLQQTLMDLDKACRIHGTWNVNWRGKSGKLLVTIVPLSGGEQDSCGTARAEVGPGQAPQDRLGAVSMVTFSRRHGEVGHTQA